MALGPKTRAFSPAKRKQQGGGRSDNAFWSVDSAPQQYSHGVPFYRAPLLLVVFAILATGTLYAFGNVGWLKSTFPQHDLYFFSGYSGYYTVSIRIFMLCFFIAFAMFMDRRPLYVAGMIADMCITYVAACALLDGGSFVIWQWLGVALNVHAVAIISGVIGFGIFSLKLLERGRMPPRKAMKIDTSRNWQTATALGGVAILCAGLSAWVSSLDLHVVNALRDFALLGGIGPGVFLFLPCFFVSLYFIGTMRLFRTKHDRFCPPVTVFVPAHNEEYVIGEVILSVDRAAARYDGPVVMMVANNNSSDRTAEVARAALARCHHLVGVVFDETRPGKANALNAAIAAVETDYMIRLDADTIMDRDALVRAMRHFRDPSVGVVGGLPVAPGGGLFDRARYMEAIVKHGFYSVGMGTINSVVGIPGMMAAYRSELPKKLGGFVQGMNGEDTDMSVRIGEMGYALIVDPEVRYVSEVPSTYAHMREQRMRWFRSVYHISSRCRDMIFSPRATVRGKIVLPYMLINSGRRAMMVPLILFALIEFFGGFHTLNPLQIQAVIAVTVGAPALIALFATLVNGEVRAVLFLPEYLLFRILRALFTLESMLSISIKAKAEQLEKPVFDYRKAARDVWGRLVDLKW